MNRRRTRSKKALLAHIRAFFASRPLNLVVGIAGSLGFAVAGVVSYSDATALRDRGEEATGLVLEVHRQGRDAWVVVQFQTQDGAEVTANVHDYYWRSTPKIGDTPRLLYDPKSPTTRLADARLGPDFGEIWVLAAASFAMAVLSWLVWTNRISLAGS